VRWLSSQDIGVILYSFFRGVEGKNYHHKKGNSKDRTVIRILIERKESKVKKEGKGK